MELINSYIIVIEWTKNTKNSKFNFDLFCRQDREKFVIATKCFNFLDPSNPNSGGLSRKHIMDSVKRSLNRLQTHYIDLFQVMLIDRISSSTFIYLAKISQR